MHHRRRTHAEPHLVVAHAVAVRATKQPARVDAHEADRAAESGAQRASR